MRAFQDPSDTPRQRPPVLSKPCRDLPLQHCIAPAAGPPASPPGPTQATGGCPRVAGERARTPRRVAAWPGSWPHSTAQHGGPCPAARPGADGSAWASGTHPCFRSPHWGLPRTQGASDPPLRGAQGEGLSTPTAGGQVPGWCQKRLDRVGSWREQGVNSHRGPQRGLPPVSGRARAPNPPSRPTQKPDDSAPPLGVRRPHSF